jgi:PilZ domain
MDEKKYSRRQGVKRHAIATDRDCRLGVISFENLIWTEHSVKIIDLSITGIGVETERQIEPGIVWFKEHVYGQRCGFLVWSKKSGDRYRSGIQFVSLTRSDEEYLHRQVSRVLPCEPFQDPDQVLVRMRDDINKDRDWYINPSA